MSKTFCRLLAVLLLFLPIFATTATAQTSPSDAVKTETQERLNQNVQELAGALADIEKRVDVTNATPGSLAILAEQITPLVPKTQALVDRLAPRVAAFKARLEQLGKQEKDEGADIAKDRAAAEKQFAENDGLLKRVKALALKAQQDSAYIARRQRTLFTSSLFQRSTSILNPTLWGNLVRELPTDITDVTRVLRLWLDDFNRSLTGGKRIVFWVFVAIVLVLYWPATRVAKRLVRKEVNVETPSDWHKVLVGCWTAVSAAALTIAAMYGIVYLLSFFVPPDPRLMPLYSAMQGGVIRLAVAAALGRAILAPFRPKWRLLAIDDSVANRLMRLVVGVTTIVTIVKVVEALGEVIDASLNISIATRGFGTALIGLTLTAGLISLRVQPDEGVEEGPVAAPSYSFAGILRGATWALVVVIAVALLVGYVPFASFLGEQMVRVAAMGAILYLVIRLTDGLCETALQPKSRLGRNLIYTVGLRRETLQQLAVIVSGVVRLSLVVAALMIVVAPWGMQSSDLSGNLNAIFFGFKVGDVTISLAGIAVAIGSFALVLAASHTLQRWLEERYLPTTRLDQGLRNSIKTSLGYVGFILALAVAAADLGVDFQKLAIVAGALSVGIGFGLQSIVNNFVSGLILLWERAVRVGDWVIVGADQGYVRKINVRSTEIETFDRTSVIVPNSNLVTGIVKNLMRADRTGRITIDLTVNSMSDPEKVREVLIDIARDNDDVVSLPSPQVRFTELTAAAMNFSLFCFVSDVENMARTKSDLYFEIYKQFRQNKFFDGPAPDPTRIAFTDLERIAKLLNAPRERDDEDAGRMRKTA